MARIETDPNYSAPTFSRATTGTDLFRKEDVQSLAAAFSTHNHETGKGVTVAIPAGSIEGIDIAAGTINGNMHIAPGTIGTALLEAYAVTQNAIATGVSSNPTTTSATMVDCPDMTISYTTHGGDTVVWFLITMQGNPAATYGTTNIALDGVDSGAIMAAQAPAANGLLQVVNMLRLPGVSLGSTTHTFKGRWSAGGGGTLTANSTNRVLALVEFKR